MTVVQIPFTNARNNDVNDFVPHPDDHFALLGSNADTVLGDGDDATGVHFRIDQFGASTTGGGAIADFDIPGFDSVTAAVMHLRARCTNGDDRPAVTTQSVYFTFGTNIYGVEADTPAWVFNGYTPLGTVGDLVAVDLDMFDPDVFFAANTGGEAVPPSIGAMATYFVGAKDRAGQNMIGFATGGYGTIETEVYEAWFEVTGTLAEAPPEPSITGLLGPTRTVFYPPGP